MSESLLSSPEDATRLAYQQGHRVGMATAALALGVISFLNLLGMEKSLLAIVFAVIAIRGASPVVAAVRRARIALVLAGVHIATIIVVLVVFRDKLREILGLLYSLS